MASIIEALQIQLEVTKALYSLGLVFPVKENVYAKICSNEFNLKLGLFIRPFQENFNNQQRLAMSSCLRSAGCPDMSMVDSHRPHFPASLTVRRGHYQKVNGGYTIDFYPTRLKGNSCPTDTLSSPFYELEQFRPCRQRECPWSSRAMRGKLRP